VPGLVCPFDATPIDVDAMDDGTKLLVLHYYECPECGRRLALTLTEAKP